MAQNGEEGMRVIYVTPQGEAIPCKVGKDLIVPQVKGGYKILRLSGFPIKRKVK